MYKHARTRTHTHQQHWLTKRGWPVITSRCEPWGGFRSAKAIYYMHAWSQPVKRQKKGGGKKCWKILVHSSGSVLWHRNSAQGSFEASCNTKGNESKPEVQREEFWNAPLVSLFTMRDLFRGLWYLPAISLHISIVDWSLNKASQHDFVVRDVCACVWTQLQETAIVLLAVNV